MSMLESVSNVFSYFNPTRSPYYSVALAACLGLSYACDVQLHHLWLWLAIPAFLVAALALFLSLDSTNSLSKSEHDDQLRFARSTSISVAVIALCVGGQQIAALASLNILNFVLTVCCCCAQIVLFILYSWVFNRSDKSRPDRNYVQITLLTSAFLADTCWNLVKASDRSDPGSTHHQITVYALGLLWLICVGFWVQNLFAMGVFQVKRPVEQSSQSSEAA